MGANYLPGRKSARHGAEIRHASRKKEGINPSRLIDGEKKKKKACITLHYAALLGTYLFYYKRCGAMRCDHCGCWAVGVLGWGLELGSTRSLHSECIASIRARADQHQFLMQVVVTGHEFVMLIPVYLPTLGYLERGKRSALSRTGRACIRAYGRMGAWLCHRRIGIFGRVEQAVRFFSCLCSVSGERIDDACNACSSLPGYLGTYPSVRT